MSDLLDQEGVADEIKTDLKIFLRIKWFWRIWVIQEVVVAKDAVVFCGPCHLSWEHFAPDTKDNGDDGLIASVKSPHLESVVPPVLRIKKRRSPRPTDLVDLLFATNSCGATDPRDRVYAMLWCDENGSFGTLEPDYTKSVAQVFREVTLHCILSTNSLKILSRIQMPLKSAESWIPSLAEPIELPLLGTWIED